MLPKYTQSEIVTLINNVIQNQRKTVEQQAVLDSLSKEELEVLTSIHLIWTEQYYQLAAQILGKSQIELTEMLLAEDLSSVSFRALENTEEILEKTAQINDIFEKLAYQIKTSATMEKETYKDTIKRIQPYAEAFIKEKALEYPIKSSMQTLSQLGYYIIKAQAPTNLSGFYMKKDKYPFIFVNTNHSLGRQNFSLWHEVYHHISNHRNGVSDFNAKSIEEREAEIFAGIVLLPDSEIDKWKYLMDLSLPENIAKLSEYYQMSFNAIAVRVWQAGIIDYQTFNEKLRPLSKVEYQSELNNLYEDNQLSTMILNPTQDIKISQNIQELLQNNYNEKKINTDYVNQLIEQIEVLNDDE
ncbi:ImmA/IrrE family metallo-endopeptidase [Staphylococcus simulans]|uniref:ImmA/IrrE family metallo-endopeptidase n=1 Tax=Staphylococcus simulans TaxID=1286 RepID=UPI0021D2D470|nr:ImmA/IrrE family metallo-endopeptidase [Staphylococcus simulans]UXR38043.1 ImmA/IrrE family metallo-endopeptidase [Staphylococcus simulans]